MDCIDRFKGMQDCFREHPDIYGAELEDGPEDEEIQAGDLPEPGALGTTLAGEGTEPAGSLQVGERGLKEKMGDGVEAVKGGAIAAATAAKEKVEDRVDTLKNDIPTEAKPANARSQSGVETVTEDIRPVTEAAKDKIGKGVETLKKDVDEKAQTAKEQLITDGGEPLSESDDPLPKAAHDAR